MIPLSVDSPIFLPTLALLIAGTVVLATLAGAAAPAAALNAGCRRAGP